MVPKFSSELTEIIQGLSYLTVKKKRKEKESNPLKLTEEELDKMNQTKQYVDKTEMKEIYLELGP